MTKGQFLGGIIALLVSVLIAEKELGIILTVLPIAIWLINLYRN